MTDQSSTTRDEVTKKLNSLPEEARDYIYTPKMRDILMKIGEKHHLHLDQLGILETETGLAMLGFIEPQDYEKALVDIVHLEKSIAEAVAKDINEMLFIKIREGMKKSYEAQKAPLAPQMANPIAISKPPAPAAAVPTPPTSPKATQGTAKPAELHPADMLLTQKSVTATPAAVPKSPAPPTASQGTAPTTSSPTNATPPPPIKPKNYANDPYREPIN